MRQWKVRVVPLSVSLTSRPLLATIRLGGTVTRMSMASGLSVLTSLQGHQWRAPKGSLNVQIMVWPPKLSQPKYSPEGLPL